MCASAGLSSQERLEEVDWNFSNARTDDLHSLHPYPARFIPEIPRELIKAFAPSPGRVVLDPFCGSGTTLVEAQRAGYRAVGIDLSPLATLISKVKTTTLPSSLAGVASDIARTSADSNITIPPIPRLEHWFRQDVQSALSRLISAITEVADEHVRDALRVALSRIIVRVSNQESDTRYAAIEKGLNDEDTVRLFFESACFVDRVILRDQAVVDRSGQVKVITADLLSLAPSQVDEPVGLVITSPPYPNAYEYWLYHKYRMYWLGMDPIAVRRDEIGARPKYFGSKPQTEADFEAQMRQCFAFLSQVMEIGAVACFLIGRSIIRGKHIDNAAILRRAALSTGFLETGMVQRSINPARKSFNLAHASINTESIMTFKLGS